MHKVKELWNRVLFREAVDPDSVYENRLSPTEVADGYLNLSNMDVPPRCYLDEELLQVVMINVNGKSEEPVTYRCRQRRTKGKKGKVFKRQRFWPVGFGLKEWFKKQGIEVGDLILMAVALESKYLIFRAIRPKTLLIVHDRREQERRDLERRFDDRRKTIIHVAYERRRRERRRQDRRTNERRKASLLE
ncbi:hypothetical protein JW933_09160 [candidate division FCPU426 bacterium]|nr:hypothetical protein [candidate division FCPU426 bacterium]